MDQSHRNDMEDDDTGDSLDGLILSVVDSLGDDPQAQRHARPTSAPPVEGNSISQNLFLNERQRADPLQDFLTKSPGQMLGSGLRKRAQEQIPGQAQAMNSMNSANYDDVLSSLPQMSLSSPTSPLGQNAARFDFLDLPRTGNNHFHTSGGIHSAAPPPQHESNHQRSLSQGSYGYPLGPQLLSQVAATHANGSTPLSSPPLSDAGDAPEDRGSEAEIQQQIEELQRRLQWQRQMAMKQQIPSGHYQQQQPMGNQAQMRMTSDGWSTANVQRSQQQHLQQQMQQQQQMYAQSGYAMPMMNGGSRYDQTAYGMETDYRQQGYPGMMTGQMHQTQHSHHHGSNNHHQGGNGMKQHNNHTSHKMNGIVAPVRVQGVAVAGMAAIPAGFIPTGQTMAVAFAPSAAQVPAFPQDKLPVDAPLEQLEGRFLQLAQEQNGCRYLQQRIAREGPTGAALVLREVFPHLVQLMMDPFANYMYQKLLEHAAPEQRLRMLEAVRGSLLVASLNLHGTRSVQKHIEMGGKDVRQRDIIAAELAPHVTKLSMDTNGNHVVQRMLQHLDRCDFVCEAIIKDLLIVTRHRHGCCVVQRSLDAADSPLRTKLIGTIEANALQLMQDPFANYTVQYVIENGNPAEGVRIIELIRGKMETLSKQKFSSNVVERCLSAAPPALLQQFVDEAIACMGELLHDAYANFVAQKMLDPITNDFQARSIVAAMRPHLLDLNPSCSRRVANRIVKRFPELMADDVIQKVLGTSPGMIQMPMVGMPMQTPTPPPPPPHMSALMRPPHMVAAPQIPINARNPAQMM